MSKGYVLLDIPEKCVHCQFYFPARDIHTGKYVSSCKLIPTLVIKEPKAKPEWCPIKELSEANGNLGVDTDSMLGEIGDFLLCEHGIEDNGEIENIVHSYINNGRDDLKENQTSYYPMGWDELLKN